MTSKGLDIIDFLHTSVLSKGAVTVLVGLILVVLIVSTFFLDAIRLLNLSFETG